MKVVKERAASVSYGRGSDNYRVPATYAVVAPDGAKVGIILGSKAGYMEKSTWAVYWVSPEGAPRVKHWAKSFTDAKAWALAWDGSPPERWASKA